MSTTDQSRWLPLFMEFGGKRCLIVGGGSVAARKAQRLVAAGAAVTVVAPALGATMSTLVARGVVTHHCRCYEASDIEGQALIVAATNDEAINTDIANTARSRNIPVNVATPGELSSVTLPAVIDRAPLQIAINSGGAAPALVRQLNRHLSAVVPQAYGTLAQLLAEFRDKITAALPDAEARRHFHDALIEGPIAEQVFAGEVEQARQQLQQAIKQQVAPRSGEVYLVGAGPGNPELLTLRALRLMQKADVVIHDRLIGPEVLALLRADSERYYVGKARDNHARTQDEINQLLLEHARAGKKVLRLKGGDPFIFGRGGEEIETLMAEDIPVHVVPGITAANGCAAYAGIPLTHRDHAHACLFVTGHFCHDETDVDWHAMAQPGQTLVFYMGVYNLQKICERLLSHGIKAETPAAIIQNGTLPTQQITISTVAGLREQQIDHAIPGLIIISETVKLSPHYRAAPAVAEQQLTPPHFSRSERDNLYRIIAARRDMRHFIANTQIEEETLTRLLSAAHRAPSVGLMQPWRFIRIRTAKLRSEIAALVDAEKLNTATALGDRSAEFMRLKVEGIRECAELLVVALAPDDGTVFGRRTLPQDMAMASAACAIENMWLAARAENLGMGWVSIFDPVALAQMLEMPEGSKPIAILCLGPVQEFYSAPMLELEGWRKGRPLSEMVFEERWGTHGDAQS